MISILFETRLPPWVHACAMCVRRIRRQQYVYRHAPFSNESRKVAPSLVATCSQAGSRQRRENAKWDESALHVMGFFGTVPTPFSSQHINKCGVPHLSILAYSKEHGVFFKRECAPIVQGWVRFSSRLRRCDGHHAIYGRPSSDADCPLLQSLEFSAINNSLFCSFSAIAIAVILHGVLRNLSLKAIASSCAAKGAILCWNNSLHRRCMTYADTSVTNQQGHGRRHGYGNHTPMV